jgi:hypothetical protein
MKVLALHRPVSFWLFTDVVLPVAVYLLRATLVSHIAQTKL